MRRWVALFFVILGAWLLLGLTSGPAAAGTVQGTVSSEGETSKPIEGVLVVAVDLERGLSPPPAATDADGVYVLEDLAPGRYQIVVDPSGMEFAGVVSPEVMRVGEGETLEGVDFRLSRRAVGSAAQRQERVRRWGAGWLWPWGVIGAVAITATAVSVPVSIKAYNDKRDRDRRRRQEERREETRRKKRASPDQL